MIYVKHGFFLSNLTFNPYYINTCISYAFVHQSFILNNGALVLTVAHS